LSWYSGSQAMLRDREYEEVVAPLTGWLKPPRAWFGLAREAATSADPHWGGPMQRIRSNRRAQGRPRNSPFHVIVEKPMKAKMHP
jgi:hypothetical protein